MRVACSRAQGHHLGRGRVGAVDVGRRACAIGAVEGKPGLIKPAQLITIFSKVLPAQLHVLLGILDAAKMEQLVHHGARLRHGGVEVEARALIRHIQRLRNVIACRGWEQFGVVAGQRACTDFSADNIGCRLVDDPVFGRHAIVEAKREESQIGVHPLMRNGAEHPPKRCVGDDHGRECAHATRFGDVGAPQAAGLHCGLGLLLLHEAHRRVQRA